MPTPYIEGLTNLRELGRGGFGVVYQAHQPAFGRDVAVKVIPGGSVDADAIARFERECRATGSVSGHPNIVRVHDAGITGDGDPYLVMDLLSGGTLAERVRRDGPLDVAAALSIGVGLAGALETAHRAGIVHRDVKPENVLFSDFGEPQLVDFGIARMQNAYESRSGSVSATIAHAAPEVIAGAEATPQSDVYSLGSVLYLALRGESAFGRARESSLAPLINRISTEPVPDLRAHGVPDALATVVERAMAKEPGERFSSAAEFGEALRAAGAAADLPTGPVPIAAGRVTPPAASAAAVPAGNEEVTDLTSFRQREAVAGAAGAVPPTSSPLTRGRLLAVAVLVVAILLAVAATAMTGDGDDRVAAGPSSTTAPTTTVADTTTTVAEETTTTSVEETTTAGDPAVVVTTTAAPPTTRFVPPPPTTAPTTTTTAAPIRAPSAVVDARSADPVAVQEVDGVPQRVRITLSWQPPFDNGGSGPTEYRIRCTLMQQSAPYIGPGDPAPCRGGTDIGAVPGNVTSYQPVVERVEPGPLTWLRWEIIPVNEGGAGPATTVTVITPNFVGLKTWEAYPFGRVIGLAVSGGQKDCGREPSTVCEQSRSAGGPLASGSNVVLYEQP